MFIIHVRISVWIVGRGTHGVAVAQEAGAGVGVARQRGEQCQHLQSWEHQRLRKLRAQRLRRLAPHPPRLSGQAIGPL
eukprot:5910318-Pyramimonas_sp.AAC.1